MEQVLPDLMAQCAITFSDLLSFAVSSTTGASEHAVQTKYAYRVGVSTFGPSVTAIFLRRKFVNTISKTRFYGF
jgi:hypothetical protein